MMVPRDSSPLTLFIQISLAIHVSPSAQPLKNRSSSQLGTLGPHRHEQQDQRGDEHAGDDAALEPQAGNGARIQRPEQDHGDEARGGDRADGKARGARAAQRERDQRRLKAEDQPDAQAAREHRPENQTTRSRLHALNSCACKEQRAAATVRRAARMDAARLPPERQGHGTKYALRSSSAFGLCQSGSRRAMECFCG